jgi:hypothetical protein
MGLYPMIPVQYLGIQNAEFHKEYKYPGLLLIFFFIFFFIHELYPSVRIIYVVSSHMEGREGCNGSLKTRFWILVMHFGIFPRKKCGEKVSSVSPAR